MKTKGKEAARTLQLYRHIIADMGDAISIADPRGRFMGRNDAHRRLFGYSDRQFLRMSPADLMGRKQVQEVARELILKGTFRGEITYRGPGGRPVHVETVIFPVRDEEGRVIAFAGSHRDLRPKKAVEERLRRAGEELQFQKSVLESQSEASPDGILVVSPEGRILSTNRRFSKMWGMPENLMRKGSDRAALRHALTKIVRPRDFLARVRHLYKRMREVSRDEIQLKDGRTFDRFTAPVLSRDGSILGRVWYFRDVTSEKRAMEEQKRALAALKNAQAESFRNEKLALVGMLVSGVAHEINNPINVVHGNLTLLRGAIARRARPDGRRVAAMLRDALKAAVHARDVIREFRTFARDPRSAEPTDLNRCVKETLAIARRDLMGIRVRRRLSPLPRVRAFHGQMNQVLLNLVKNAAEAMKGKGTLTITSAARAGRVRVTVADTGPGIPRAERARIFDPFYTTKEHGRGMGLGLSISASIVQNHGGRLTLSPRSSRGATFVLDLPRV